MPNQVTDQQDNEADELRRANATLKQSLAMCRFMLAEARAKLGANSNEPARREQDEDAQSR